MSGASTIDIAETSSGKTHRHENFPVASFLIAPRHRAPILAFYNFVRAADDISDHPTLAPADKLALLDRLEAALLQKGPDEPVARALREISRERGLSLGHARDLVTAFRRDVTQLRYKDWDDLIDYCRYSAMPVGRFVLDVHGENAGETWAANDALCAALQIINHLQDCGKDYRDLDRVYLPLDTLQEFGASVEMLALPAAPAPLRAALEETGRANRRPSGASAPLRGPDRRRAPGDGGRRHPKSRRIADPPADVADPLSEKVHASKAQFALVGALGATAALLRRFGPPQGGGRSIVSVTESAAQAQKPKLTAKKSSFYLAMRVLEPPRRDAMFAIYAFCRAVDDIADEEGDRDERRRRLTEWRRDLDELYAGRTRLRCAQLAEPVRRYGLERADFEAVIDGMEMDVDQDIRAPDWATLDRYCDNVASAVGRLSIRAFGLVDEFTPPGKLPEDARLLAHHLGRALQLTNILRDLDEDAERGRLYLPREALLAAGIVRFYARGRSGA